MYFIIIKTLLIKLLTIIIGVEILEASLKKIILEEECLLILE